VAKQGQYIEFSRLMVGLAKRDNRQTQHWHGQRELFWSNHVDENEVIHMDSRFDYVLLIFLACAFDFFVEL